MLNRNKISKQYSIWAFTYLTILIISVGIFGAGINAVCIVNFLILLFYLFVFEQKIKLRKVSVKNPTLNCCLYIMAISIINTLIGNSLYTLNPIDSITRIIVIFISMLFFSIYISEKADLDLFMLLFVYLVLVGCIFGVVEKIIGHHLFKGVYREAWDYTNNMIRVNSFFIHPNLFGITLLLALIYLIYHPFEKKKQFFSIAIIILNIYLTRSKGVWIALALLLFLVLIEKMQQELILGLIDRKKIRNTMINATMVSLFSLIILSINKNSSTAVFNDIFHYIEYGILGDSVSKMNRVHLLVESLIFLGSREGFRYLLIGGGDGFAMAFLSNHYINGWTGAVDNQYLTLLMNYGVISVIMFLVIIISAFTDLFRTDIIINAKMYSLMLVIIGVCLFFYEGFAVYSFIGFLTFWIMFARIRTKAG